MSLEILRDLEKEFAGEVRKAHKTGDASAVKYWQDIIDNCLCSDKDRPKNADIQNTQKKVLDKNEALIVYYERKLKIIKKCLGNRLTQLLESFEEKNILMGQDSSSGRLIQDLQDEEDKRMSQKQKKDFTFDKM